jgi:hypothetical protein
MEALVAFHGTEVQEKPSRVEVNRPFRDLHHIGGLGDSLHTPHRGKTPRNKVAVMKHFILSRLGKPGNAVVAALVAVAAIGGWGASTTFGTRAVAVESHYEISAKATLVGSYTVIGTDVDGTSYTGSHTLDISLAPSGALELEWDNGKQVGVGQVIGDVLAVACLSKGRTMILTMNINPDGSLSGKWSRRTDRGTQGTETWTKT